MNRAQIGFICIEDCMLEKFWTMNKQVVPLEIMQTDRGGMTKYLVYCREFAVVHDGSAIMEYYFNYNGKAWVLD